MIYDDPEVLTGKTPYYNGPKLKELGQMVAGQLLRVSTPGSATPTVSVYASRPKSEFDGLRIGANGTMYVAGYLFLLKISGTNTELVSLNVTGTVSPPTITTCAFGKITPLAYARG